MEENRPVVHNVPFIWVYEDPATNSISSPCRIILNRKRGRSISAPVTSGGPVEMDYSTCTNEQFSIEQQQQFNLSFQPSQQTTQPSFPQQLPSRSTPQLQQTRATRPRNSSLNPISSHSVSSSKMDINYLIN